MSFYQKKALEQKISINFSSFLHFSKSKSYAYLLTYLLTAIVLSLSLVSCSEDTDVSKAIQENDATIEYRSSGGISMLINIQTYLRDLRDHGSSKYYYSEADILKGSETLLNIKYGHDTTGIPLYSVSDSVFFNGDNHFEVFNQIENKIVNMQSLSVQESIYLIDLELKGENTSNQRWLVKAVMQKSNQCIENEYFSQASEGCDGNGPFDEGDAYPLWLGGYDDEHPPWPAESIDCEACGETTTCGAPDGYAMEEIQHHLNANNPDPTCPPGQIWTGEYEDITSDDYVWLQDWNQYSSHADCFNEYHSDGFSACSCFEYEILNCLYCEYYNDMIASEQLFNIIPAGYEVIFVNLGVEYCVCGGIHPDDYVTSLLGNVVYGKPICVDEKDDKEWDIEKGVSILDFELQKP